MKAQEIFDTVATHLMKQKERAFNHSLNMCAYRGSNNTKCAIGCLIPDEMYTQKMEANTVSELFAKFLNVADHIGGEHLSLCSDLQKIHDDIPWDWKNELINLAEKRGLELPECLK